MTVVYVCFFGVLGVLARYGAGIGIGQLLPHAFPFATFFINLTGSFLAGMVYVLGMERGLFSPEIRVGLAVGFLGGFTTFSSYCLEAVRLAEEGSWLPAALYFAGSPLFGGAAAGIGIWLGRRWMGLA